MAAKSTGKGAGGEAKAATTKAASKAKPAKKAATKKAPAKKATAKKAPAKKATKKKAPAKKASKKSASADGKQLVVVESPAKARTIERYLGDDFVVKASVGHIRDLPSKSPKGVKQVVPGVDVDNDFQPSYEVLKDKTKTVNELKKVAKKAKQVWFATDLDREGEAISWHLAEILGIDPSTAKRVVFNAITKSEIQKAFTKPRPIDLYRVNAQQARRILDRIVGYQVSPLLWKKVARGLSAGRVQSVAVRMVVDREREIEAFTPDETWKFAARLALEPKDVGKLGPSWADFISTVDDRGKPPTIKLQNKWMAEHAALRGELVEIGGEKFDLGCPADDPRDLSDEVSKVALATGMTNVEVECVEDPEGSGPARYKRTVTGDVKDGVRYSVRSIETKRTSSRPSAPFITSSLQIAAANQLSFAARRTMRLAQGLYEGVELGGGERVGLITYMRTDSTNIAPEAMAMVRDYIGKELGPEYLAEKPISYTSANKDAQEAHEAIRPTDVTRHPDEVRKILKGDQAEAQYKLYKLIWSRFVACQMTRAKWDSTAVLFERSDEDTGAVFKVTGRTLAFDGFYRVTGVPTSSDEQTLPELSKGQELAPFIIEPRQKFSSPPPRFTEASLVKALEAEGIGRPSTYASIIQVIQDRNYVEQLERRFYATDLGEVVTDKLVEAFPHLLDKSYTRQMEAELDKVEDNHTDWVVMLREFYVDFAKDLETAHEELTHAKAEIQPAPYACPECGSKTCYRFGKNGRFLSCTAYPDCNYAAPIDRKGRPLLAEKVDVVSPDDGSDMELRKGRFGPFLASVNYPDSKFVLNLDKKGGIKYPAPPPLKVEELECPKCDSPMNLRRGKRGPWLGCSTFP
ncbi:MAG: topoisomerase DNA-binding C4 zinc finger domain-containing protein, partial [Deltaproteobacteria bacterium]|nr:topoisomerase DNA-binding C4 zinc finger domain-containing protein [Deltaproteobacteria bacterium]